MHGAALFGSFLLLLAKRNSPNGNGRKLQDAFRNLNLGCSVKKVVWNTAKQIRWYRFRAPMSKHFFSDRTARRESLFFIAKEKRRKERAPAAASTHCPEPPYGVAVTAPPCASTAQSPVRGDCPRHRPGSAGRLRGKINYGSLNFVSHCVRAKFLRNAGRSPASRPFSPQPA